MKKLITLIFVGILALNISAQTFSDNFDSYNVGDYIGVVSSEWTTWSGTTGGAEDAKVSAAQASSTPNSAYFQSTATGGGPQDVVLNFGGVNVDGIFTYEMSMFVETGKGAYFNFQGSATIGEVWAMSCYLINDGKIYIENSENENVVETTYPVNTWFNIKIVANLSQNRWNAYINNELVGTWANPVNKIASIDIFPINPASHGGNGKCNFYIDNVSYNIEEYVLPALNGAVILVDKIGGLVGQERNIYSTIKNIGNDMITSFDLEVMYLGNQVTSTTVSNVQLGSLETYDFAFTTPVVLAEGKNDLSVTISNVNGLTDDDPSDDTQIISINPIVPAEGKIVLGEEATGTWCQWCPRGAVFMDFMEENYHGYWAGIAVHNNDPMVNATYDKGIGTLISGYPSALVNRGADIDPSGLEADFLKQIVIAPSAVITNGIAYNEVTGELNISAIVDWKKVVTGNWKVACMITEDHVTGTSSGYDQANSYSGGTNGEMGGYENLTNPVLAEDMVYDHVARQILPEFGGKSLLNISGESTIVNFSTVLDAEWNTDNMKIIIVLINTTGKVDNAGLATFGEALANGFVQAPASTETNILTFTLAEQHSAAVIDVVNHTVNIEVNAGTNVTALVPTITLSNGATVNPASGVAKDFSSAVTYKVTAEDNVTTMDWVVNVSVYVGINDAGASKASIYPNPVKDQLFVTNLNNVTKVIISNVLGQDLMVMPVTESKITLNTAELRKGIYIITFVSTDGVTRSERIVKE